MLLVDIGNTRVKWATLEAGLIVPAARRVACAVGRSAVARCPVCGGPSNARHRGVSRRVDEPRVSRASGGGERHHGAIRCEFHAGRRRDQAYADPSLLGVDRWLAVIGAYHLRRSACCVVDVGTAATIDAVDEQGRHLGGFIVPGPQLMVASLHSGTSDLAAHTARSTPATNMSFATNTRDAIERGCRVALAALVDRAFQELAARGTTPPALLGTGGAIEQIAPFINGPLAVVPELVLRGLAALAQART